MLANLISTTANASKSIVEKANPYLLNPITLIRSLVRGKYTRNLNGVNATFNTQSFWDTASLLHTFKKESIVINDIIGKLKPDDIFYDIGANKGVFTCFANEIITHGSVVAFEPHPINMETLKQNVNSRDKSTTFYQCALSDESGTASLSVDQGWAGDQRHALATSGDESNTIEIETIAGDDLVNNDEIQSPSVVKIDVEGAEKQVIDGMKKSLSRPDCRLIYCEIHPKLLQEFGSNADEVRKALRNVGFSLETIESSGGQLYIKGVK